MEINSWITLAAVFVALSLGVASLIQTKQIQKRERKERLLNEIIEWATEIHTASLKTNLPNIDPYLELHIEEIAEGKKQIIENTKRSIVNKEHNRIEVETLFRYCIPLSRSEYIRWLTEDNFKGLGMTLVVDKVIDNLNAFVILENKELGINSRGFG
ncbi:MAG: hypothetical protein PHY28_05820 [Dehalococcoidales bacterium]|nr:hypothetical protein [Dehalococcoidales bacterium]